MVKSIDQAVPEAGELIRGLRSELDSLAAATRSPADVRAALLESRAQQRRALEAIVPDEIAPGHFLLSTGSVFLIPHFFDVTESSDAQGQSDSQANGGDR